MDRNKGVQYWTVDSGAAAADNPAATMAGQDTHIHIIDSLMVRNTNGNKTWSFSSGGKTIFIGDIGNETLIEMVILTGQPGEDVKISTNGNGNIAFSGHTINLP